MRISIYLLTGTPTNNTYVYILTTPIIPPTSHAHLLLTTPITHTHRFHPLFTIVIQFKVWMTEVWMTIVESGWNLWVWLVGVVIRRRCC